MTVNAHGIVKCFDVFKNQFMCMCIIKDFKLVDPFSKVHGKILYRRYPMDMLSWNNCESYLWAVF